MLLVFKEKIKLLSTPQAWEQDRQLVNKGNVFQAHPKPFSNTLAP